MGAIWEPMASSRCRSAWLLAILWSMVTTRWSDPVSSNALESPQFAMVKREPYCSKPKAAQSSILDTHLNHRMCCSASNTQVRVLSEERLGKASTLTWRTTVIVVPASCPLQAKSSLTSQKVSTNALCSSSRQLLKAGSLSSAGGLPGGNFSSRTC